MAENPAISDKYREPEATQYPINIETTSGPCTVLRHRQIYQHIQLKLSWKDTGGVDFVWITLADNCENNFELCADNMPANVHKLVRRIAKGWLDNWEAKTGY